MPQKTPIRVVRKKPTPTGQPGAQPGNGNSMIHGIFTEMSHRNLDQRSKMARIIRHVEAELVSALGGEPSPQEMLLVGRVAFKMIRCVLYEAEFLRTGGELKGDNYYIAWSNSLRLDLQTLGLTRRAKAVQDLQSYLREAAK